MKENIFVLSWKKLGLVLIGGFLSIILHNLISELFGKEEAFFFILVIFVLPTYLLVSILVTLVKVIKRKSKG